MTVHEFEIPQIIKSGEGKHDNSNSYRIGIWNEFTKSESRKYTVHTYDNCIFLGLGIAESRLKEQHPPEA